MNWCINLCKKLKLEMNEYIRIRNSSNKKRIPMNSVKRLINHLSDFPFVNSKIDMDFFSDTFEPMSNLEHLFYTLLFASPWHRKVFSSSTPSWNVIHFCGSDKSYALTRLHFYSLNSSLLGNERHFKLE